jgi:hypothetical protein
MMIKFMKGCFTFVLLGTAVIVGSVMLGVKEFGRQKRVEQIEASLAIDSKSGELRYPLVVTIQNNSGKSLTKSNWRLAAYEKDRSTQILEDNSYASDFIVPSGGIRRFRCDLPNAKPDCDAVNKRIEDYRWDVVLVDAQFSADYIPAVKGDEVEKISNSGRLARIRQEATDEEETAEGPSLLGMRSILFSIESSGWRKTKKSNFLLKLLGSKSQDEEPIRPFEIRLDMTNNSNVRLNIANVPKFDLHGNSDVYHLDQDGGMGLGGDAGLDSILEPNESRTVTLVYKVDTRFSSFDEDVWSLRLTEGTGDVAKHFYVLKHEK